MIHSVNFIHERHIYYLFFFFFIYSITNLKYWSNSEIIISKTLQILNDLSVGYSSVRKLVKLEEVQFILSNHTVCPL